MINIYIILLTSISVPILDYVDTCLLGTKLPFTEKTLHLPSWTRRGFAGYSQAIVGSAIYPAITPRGLASVFSCLPSNLALSTQKVSCFCSSLTALIALQPLAPHHHSALSNGLYPDRSSCSVSAAVKIVNIYCLEVSV